MSGDGVSSDSAKQEVRQNPSHSKEIIELEYQNAKERLNTQRETIKSLSEEGARYIRLLLVLVGIPFTLLGVFEPTTLTQITTLVSSGGCFIDISGLCIPMDYIAGFGLFMLVLSLVLNTTAGGFEAYGTRNITNSNDINNLTTSTETYTEHLNTRLQEYKERISYNDEVIFTLDLALAVGKICLIISILTVGLLSYRLFVGSPLSVLLFVTVLVIIASILLCLQYFLPSGFPQFGFIYISKKWRSERKGRENSDEDNPDQS